MRQEDAMVSHFILDCDEEEPEFQKEYVNKVKKAGTFRKCVGNIVK